MRQSDIDFLLDTQRLGDLGLNQDQIAKRLGITERQWRYRMEQLGFAPSAETRIRCKRTGKAFTDLLESGEIAPLPEEEAVPA